MDACDLHEQGSEVLNLAGAPSIAHAPRTGARVLSWVANDRVHSRQVELLRVITVSIQTCIRKGDDIVLANCPTLRFVGRRLPGNLVTNSGYLALATSQADPGRTGDSRK